MKIFGILRRRLGILFSLIVVLGMVILAIFCEHLAPYDPLEVNLAVKLQPPGLMHPMGTDDMGRDILSRIIAGARLSVMTITVVISTSLLIGILIGSMAGYFGGYIDETLMLVTDIFLAFPGLILALAIVAALGPNLVNAMLAISLVWWPWYARMVRGQVLSVKQNLYVDAARVCGFSHVRILYGHILPNCLMPVIIQASLDMGAVLVTTAGLSFIGLGAQAPTPEWGAIIGIGRRYMLTAWWFSVFPGVAIFDSIQSLNLLGEFLQDILDPTGEVRMYGI